MVHIGIEKIIISKFKLPQEIKERIVDKFIYYHFRDIIPEYQMQSSEESPIDIFLDRTNAWSSLPEIIQEYEIKNTNWNTTKQQDYIHFYYR